MDTKTTYCLSYYLTHTEGQDPDFCIQTELTPKQASGLLYTLTEGDFGCSFTHLRLDNEQTWHTLTKEEMNSLMHETH